MGLKVLKAREIDVNISGVSSRAEQLGTALVNAIGTSAQTQNSILNNAAFPDPVVADPDPAIWNVRGVYINTISGGIREHLPGDEVSSPDPSIGNVYVYLADGSTPFDNRSGRRGDADTTLMINESPFRKPAPSFPEFTFRSISIAYNFETPLLAGVNDVSGVVEGDLVLTGDKAFTWDGRYRDHNGKDSMAQIIDGAGTESQVWRIEPLVNGTFNRRFLFFIFDANISTEDDTDVILTGSFSGCLVYHLTNTVPDPDVEQAYRRNPLLPAPDYPYWTIKRRTNAFSLTDRRPQVPVEIDNQIQFTIDSDDTANDLGFVNVGATSVTASLIRNGSAISSRVVNFPAADAGGIVAKTIDVLPDVGSRIATDQYRCIVRNTGKKARLGQVVLGHQQTIGNAVLSNGFEIVGLDFSTIDTNQFGEQQVTERPATTTMRFQIRILRTEIQYATAFFTELKSGRPAIFSLADDDALGTTLFGWVRTFRIAMIPNRKDYAIVTATIQGLV